MNIAKVIIEENEGYQIISEVKKYVILIFILSLSVEWKKFKRNFVVVVSTLAEGVLSLMPQSQLPVKLSCKSRVLEFSRNGMLTYDYLVAVSGSTGKLQCIGLGLGLGVYVLLTGRLPCVPCNNHIDPVIAMQIP